MFNGKSIKVKQCFYDRILYEDILIANGVDLKFVHNLSYEQLIKEYNQFMKGFTHD